MSGYATGGGYGGYGGGTGGGTLLKGGGSSFLGGLAHDVAAPVEHVVKDIGETAIGIPEGIVSTAKIAIEHPSQIPTLAKGVVKYYENYYGHDVLGHIWQHPTQFALDALSVADLGTTALARLGDVANVARLSELSKPAELVTRSPKAAFGEEGHTITKLTSTKPIVKARQLATARLSKAIDDAVKARRGQTGVGPLEGRRYGRAIQRTANQTALRRVQVLFPHVKAFNKLSRDERAATNLRSLDIHPDDLREYWGDTKNAQDLTDKVGALMLNPSEKMQKAEALMRETSAAGAGLFKLKGVLSNESELDRPGRFKGIASQELGRDVRSIHGEPYYIPHTTGPVTGSSPLQDVGGGKALPKTPGTAKANMGELFSKGLLDVHHDVLGPEFARRVKWLKFHSIHQALKRGAIRLSYDDMLSRYGGKRPPGYDYLRTDVPITQSQKLARQISSMEKLQAKNPSDIRAGALRNAHSKLADLITGEMQDRVVGKTRQKIPFSIRGEGETQLHHVIPNPDDLHDSALADGFTTNKITDAYRDPNGRYYLIPKSTAKSATGEFTRSSNAMYLFNKYPVQVWRALLLGLRPAFLVNNVVGNSLMYAIKTGGQGAIRDLFGAMRELHGDRVARKLLADKATPAEMRPELEAQLSPLRSEYPEQGRHATFGFTQTPADTGLRGYSNKGMQTAKGFTAALPHFTSMVAEELPRRALTRTAIRRSPEYKALAKTMPRDTRSFNKIAKALHEGKGSAEFQQRVSEQVDRALGNYTQLSPFEAKFARTALPFYAWYRAILSTTVHLATDNPLRAHLLYSIGRIGAASFPASQLPSYLLGAINLGQGPGGTKRLLATQAINPWAQFYGFQQGGLSSVDAIGLNPFIQGVLDQFASIQNKPGATNKNVSPAALIGETLLKIAEGVPPISVVKPAGPSPLYPERGRGDYAAGIPVLGSHEAQALQWLGIPIKEPNPVVAATRAAAGQ